MFPYIGTVSAFSGKVAALLGVLFKALVTDGQTTIAITHTHMTFHLTKKNKKNQTQISSFNDQPQGSEFIIYYICEILQQKCHTNKLKKLITLRSQSLTMDSEMILLHPGEWIFLL